MARQVRSVTLSVPPERAFAACVALLESPDMRRGVLARRCEPSPPREGSTVVSTVQWRRGERELRSRIAVLRPGVEVATEGLASGTARTSLRVEAHGPGSRVTLTSEASSGLGEGRAGELLDRLLFSRSQRRAARSTLRRVRELAGG